MAKAASVTAGGVVALLCVVLLLLLSSAVTTTAEAAGRPRPHLGMGTRRDDDDGAAVTTTAASAAATTVTGMGRRLGNKVMRVEVVDTSATDGGGAGVGESKRRSPGGPDPQHH